MATKSILKQITLRDKTALGNFISALEKAESAAPRKKEAYSKRVQQVERESLASFFGKEPSAKNEL